MVPKFFKIITDPEANNLRIPAEFMRRYGDNLPNRVWLHIPKGSSWGVEVIQSSNGETWLNNGWQEFKEYYSLTFGRFLLFDYKGSCRFNVRIFDPDESEIDYPFAAINHDNDVVDTQRTESRTLEKKNVESESDDSVVFLKELFPSKKGEDKEKRKNVETSHKEKKRVSNASKRLYSDDSSSATECSNGLKAKKPVLEQDSKSRICSTSIRPSKKNPKPTSGSGSHRKESMTKKEEGSGVQMQRAHKGTSTAYKNAVEFKSNNPSRSLYHVSLMHQSYVTNNFILNFPLTFAKGNSLDRSNEVTLLAPNGEKWLVKCNFDSSHARTTGWKDFVEDNALKVGDACVFEAIKNAKLVWSVLIFRS